MTNLPENSLEELEHLVNQGGLFQNGNQCILSMVEIEAAKKEREALPIEDQSSYPVGVDPETFDNEQKAIRIAKITRVCEDASKSVQRNILLLTEDEKEGYIDELLESLEFLKHDLSHRTSKDAELEKAVDKMYKHVIYRYSEKSFLKEKAKDDKRLHLQIKQNVIHAYFQKLVVHNVISEEELKLFLHANFVGFKDQKNIKTKIKAKTSNKNLGHFMYKFKQENEIHYLGKYDLVDILLRSFDNYSRTKRNSIYKTWQKKPDTYNLF